MAATVMTVEFGIIHHYSSLEENLKLVFAILWTDTKIKVNIMKIMTFWFRITMF